MVSDKCGRETLSYDVFHFSETHFSPVCTVSYTPTQNTATYLCVENKYVHHAG